MALAIAICIAGFVTIYVQLQPYISDFITQDPPEEKARVAAAPDPTETPADDEDEEEAEPTEEPSDDEADAGANEENPSDEEDADAEPTEEPEGFNPDVQSNSESAINLRSEPNTSSEILTVLTVSQPLQTTGDTAAADNPAQDGDIWVQVETEDGLEGWLREIDTEPFEE